MISAERLKRTIRVRWCHPERVEVWKNSGLNFEFHQPAGRRAWKAALRRAAGSGKGRAALDLGTGPGTLAELWAELGYRTSGVDFSPGMVHAARERAKEKGLPITYHEGDAEHPPVKGRFDVISSRFVLFTLPHPGYAVRRWVEMLRPGGKIVLIGHDKSGFTPTKRRRRPQPGQTDPRHQDALKQLPFVNHTPGDLIVLLEAVGLRDIKRLPMDGVMAARATLFPGQKLEGVHSAPPFIIVGTK